MSFVTLAGWRAQNVARTYDMQNTAMRSAQRLGNMLNNPLQYSPDQALQKEKQLTLASLSAQTQNKCLDAQQPGIDAMLDKDIKRSFSYMA